MMLQVWINPLNAELNPICLLLTLLAHHFLHVSRIRVKSLTFSILLCTFGRVANTFEFFQCVLLVEVKVSTLKVHFVSLSPHCGNAENTFQHLWTCIFHEYFVNPTLGPYQPSVHKCHKFLKFSAQVMLFLHLASGICRS